MVLQHDLRIQQEVRQLLLPDREHIVLRPGVVIIHRAQEVERTQAQDQAVAVLTQVQVEALAEPTIQVVRPVVVPILQDLLVGHTHQVLPLDPPDLPVVRILPVHPVEVIRRVALREVVVLLPEVVHRPVHHVRADKIKN